MIKKLASFTKGSMRRIKTKTGGVKVVHVKAHANRINRKPKSPSRKVAWPGWC